MSPVADDPQVDYGRANGWHREYPTFVASDGPTYAGPVTYCKRPYITDPDEIRQRAPDIAIVGIPFDDRVSYRPGARFGPRAIRQATSTAGSHSLALGVEPFRVLDVVDTGDAEIVPAAAERGHAVAYHRVLDVMTSGAIPVILGGDHSITWPVVSAVAQSLAPRRVGMIHFDAHADTADEELGVRAGHGTPMRRLIESGALSGPALVQIGLRGYWPPPEVFDWMRGQGMRWHPMAEIEDRGIDAVVDSAIAEVREHADVVYVSVDIDVVDPGMAPGTGTPEPGGMLGRELLRAVRRIATSVDIAGMDVMEVSPPYDQADVTAMLAHRCVLETISGIAARRVASDRPGVPIASGVSPDPRRRWGHAVTPTTDTTMATGAPEATVPPDMDAHLARIVARQRDRILDVSHRIHADPEVAYQEHRAASLLADTLAAHGYRIERGVGSLPTAVRGTLTGGLGSEGPTIGVLAEYDALPGLGHGCGHNLMAASGAGAAIALAGIAPFIRGRVVFLGTPAEELGSGKETMVQEGVFDGIDAALLFHPSDRTHTRVILLASEDVEVTFTGLQSHAASDPWLGRNALDAMISLFTSIGLWRQQLRPGTRVHGIITDGGTAANIIPGYTAARFMIRAADQDTYDGIRSRFQDLVRAAALATDCEGEVTFSGRSTVMRNNEVLARLWSERMVAAGVADGEPVPELAGSADIGNVSLVLPTIHPCVAICDVGVAGHSAEFRDASVSPRADEVVLLVSTLVAQTAWALFADPRLVAAAWQEHRDG